MKIKSKIITLDPESKKTKKITQLSNENLLFEPFLATNGKKLYAAEYFKLAKNDDWLFNRKTILTPGEVGCKISHKNAIFESINENLNSIFIFEDDIDFLYSIEKIIDVHSFLDEQIDPTVIHLGGLDGLKNSKRLIFTSSHHITPDLPKIKKIFKPTLRWLYRTCAYVVNKKAALLIYETYKKNNIPADNWNYISKNNKEINFYYLPIVRHPVDLRESSIENERSI